MMQQRGTHRLRVAVIGAGVIGASTALELVQAGHEVVVLERNDSPAQGASHANAGLISPGHCYSWAEPGAVRAALSAMVGRGEGFGICDPWRPDLWRWGILFARETALHRWRDNSGAAIALAKLSRDLLFRADHPIKPSHWAGRQHGICYLHSAGRNADEDALLRGSGEPHVHLEHAQAIDRDAFFKTSSVPFDHATFCPADGTGDAARFTAEALNHAILQGAQLHYGADVLGFELHGQRARAVRTRDAEFAVDAVVIAAGLQSRALFLQLGHRLPLYPATGYSMTYRDVEALPSGGGVSLRHKVAWAPLGASTLRLTGFADIGVPGAALLARRFEALEDFARRLHPPLARCPATRWVGQRPMTPDGLPFLGASAVSNVFANCGHGAMGWTLSAACARITAELIGGSGSTVDLAPCAIDRYGRFGRRPRTNATA